MSRSINDIATNTQLRFVRVAKREFDAGNIDEVRRMMDFAVAKRDYYCAMVRLAEGDCRAKIRLSEGDSVRKYRNRLEAAESIVGILDGMLKQ